MTYLKNSTKKSLFAPNFSCTNLQSKEEAKKSATELLAVTVGHEIFTDTSECAIIMANNIVCKEVILRLSHKIPFYGGHLEKQQIKTSHMKVNKLLDFLIVPDAKHKNLPNIQTGFIFFCS